MEQNLGYSGAFVAMDNTSLGKEWKYYKRELDQIRRKAKKDAERAERGGFDDRSRPRGDFKDRGGFRSHHREGVRR
jgi:hypothetical protein